MKLSKKSLIAFSSLGLLAAPVVATVSCTATTKKTYDFGLATAPLNSLNYLKFKNTGTVIPALVEGLFKAGSADKTVQSLLNFPKYEFKIADGTETRASLVSSYLPLDEWGYLPGASISSSGGVAAVGLTSKAGDISNYSQLAFQLNSKSKWADPHKKPIDYDAVTAEDFKDTLKYILDINTGSQLLIDTLEYGIRNASLIVSLQNDYYIKHGVTYRDPWGYDGKWESQVAGDDEEVAKIRDAALGFGVLTVEDYKKMDETIKAAGSTKTKAELGIKDIAWVSKVIPSGKAVEDKRQLIYQFDESKPISRMKITDWGRRTFFLPSNRKFIEAHGGIQKFGIDRDHFIWNSAFNPETIEMGPAGYIDLVKDNNYYAAARTVSNRIKIFFQSDATVLTSMFEDGYVSDVKIPAVQQLNFWANQDIRRYMSKSTGFGTLAFDLNIENGNPALKDENFRKAMAYAIDRNELSLVAGQESSFPVTTWSAFGQAKDSYGNPIETYFDGQTYKPVSDAERASIIAASGIDTTAKDQEGKLLVDSAIPANIDIQSYPFTLHNAKVLQFERVNRQDIGYNKYYANYFMNEFKKAHPEFASGVKLTYAYDGGQTTNKNVGIYLQSKLREIFGGFVDVDIKGLPSNVFETYKTTGNFDILFYNFDSYGTEWDSYIKRFFERDGIEKNDQGVTIKTEGFRDNPSGGWTYSEFFKNLGSREEAIRQDLNIETNIWNKMKELSLSDSTKETTTAWAQRRNEFFTKSDKEKDANGKFVWQNDELIIQVVAGFEKVIRQAMPVIPLMEVDTYWEAKRVGGVDSLFAFSLQTAYDLENKPNPGLPGVKS